MCAFLFSWYNKLEKIFAKKRNALVYLDFSLVHKKPNKDGIQKERHRTYEFNVSFLKA